MMRLRKREKERKKERKRQKRTWFSEKDEAPEKTCVPFMEEIYGVTSGVFYRTTWNAFVNTASVQVSKDVNLLLFAFEK